MTALPPIGTRVRCKNGMMRSPEFTDPVTGTVALEADIPVAIAADLWTFESGPEFTTGARPLFVFVPKGATDGTD